MHRTKKKILTHDVSVAVRAKVIMVVGNHWNQIIWGEKAKTENCNARRASVEYFSGKLQQHRDRDDGKQVRQLLKKVKT